MDHNQFNPAELKALYSSLSPEERDELLQCLLMTLPRGEEAVVRMLNSWLLDYAGKEMIREFDADAQRPSDDP